MHIPVSIAMLPRPLTSFVGRERELNEVCARLLDPGMRLLNLTGPGGVGKTRLAIEVAYRATGYADGVAMIDLAPVRDATLVPATLLKALDNRDYGDRSPTDALLTMLRDREMLLVLDNLEHLPEAALLVGELVAECSGLTILSTSRIHLNLSSEHVHPLLPLETAGAGETGPAERLFLDRARQAGAGWVDADLEPDMIAEICRLLDGLPLAIELASAWSPVLSPRDLRDRLDNRLSVLTRGPVDVPTRHRTLAAAISWSENLLEPEARQLLHRLAVFSGGFWLHAAEVIAGDDVDVLQGIQVLVKASLLTVDVREECTYYRSLETIREYALKRLEESGEYTTVCERHATYYASQADRLWEPWTHAIFDSLLRELGYDHANLRAAFAWAREHDPELAMRIASGLDWYFTRFGHVDEGRAWISWCEAASEDRVDALRTRILMTSAWLTLQQNELDVAEELIRRAIAVCRRNSEPYLLANAVLQLGDVLFCLARLDEAHTINVEAQRLANEVGDPMLIAITILQEGRIAAAAGDLVMAESRLREALRRHRELDFLFGIAVARQFLAGVVTALGDSVQAATLYREVVTSWRDFGDWVNVARTMEGLAAIPNPPSAIPAVHLLGAASAIRARLHHTVDQEDRTVYAQTVARLQGALPSTVFQTVWREGTALSWDAAVDEALRFADRIAKVQASGPDAPYGLSPREWEVLRLLAKGHTDQEIAMALNISRRTVATHVQHIYNKLGVASRAAAAALAVRHGLA